MVCDTCANRESGKVAEALVMNLLKEAHGSGVQSQVHMKTDLGVRIVDVMDRTCNSIHEIKVGSLTKSQRTMAQITKDLWLRDTRGFEVNYHFFKSPETGKVGPSKSLRSMLQEEGIQRLTCPLSSL